MRYSLHTIKFTPLKVYNLVFVVYTQSCAAVTAVISCQNTFINQIKFHRPLPMTRYPPSTPPSSPGQPMVYFLSLQICILWQFCTNGTIPYVTFCGWLLSFSTVSRCTRGAAWTGTSSPCLAQYSSIVRVMPELSLHLGRAWMCTCRDCKLWRQRNGSACVREPG